MIYEVRLATKARKKAERSQKDFRFYRHGAWDIWYVTDGSLECARKRGIDAAVLKMIDVERSSVQIVESFPASAIANAVVESQRAMIEQDQDVKVLEIVTPLYGKYSFDLESIPMFISKASRHYINDLLAFEGQPPFAESHGDAPPLCANANAW